MNIFNSCLSLINRSFILREHFLPELNSTEKRITLIGIAIISCSLICLTVYRYFQNRKVKQLDQSKVEKTDLKVEKTDLNVVAKKNEYLNIECQIDDQEEINNEKEDKNLLDLEDSSTLKLGEIKEEEETDFALPENDDTDKIRKHSDPKFKTMTIFLKTMQVLENYEVSKRDKIESLQEMIQQKHRTTQRWKLFYGQKLLEDERTFEEYNIQPHSIIRGNPVYGCFF
jgi:hypothetical protein